jgi:hypothetical protein
MDTVSLSPSDDLPHTIAVWTLVNPSGRPARCLLSRCNGHRDVIVWNGPSIVLWERCHSEEEADRRADELWSVLVASGWSPGAEESGEEPPGTVTSIFRRTCAECGAPSAVVTHRRHGFIVMSCESCQERWNDRERVAAHDRRQQQRDVHDRRRAA